MPPGHSRSPESRPARLRARGHGRSPATCPPQCATVHPSPTLFAIRNLRRLCRSDPGGDGIVTAQDQAHLIQARAARPSRLRQVIFGPDLGPDGNMDHGSLPSQSMAVSPVPSRAARWTADGCGPRGRAKAAAGAPIRSVRCAATAAAMASGNLWDRGRAASTRAHCGGRPTRLKTHRRKIPTAWPRVKPLACGIPEATRYPLLRTHVNIACSGRFRRDGGSRRTTTRGPQWRLKIDPIFVAADSRPRCRRRVWCTC